jgi:hypothetical protein
MHVFKQRLQLYAGRHPRLYFGLYGVKPKNRRLSVDRMTQLVIEGFPRSANTFAVVAFEHAQRESVRLAHHLHVPAQVIRAAQWRIPSLVLIREPVDAILSLMVRHPEVSASHALHHYISFYEGIVEYHHAYVVGLFDDVTKDYGTIIERVNAKFGTRFSPYYGTEENTRDVFARIEEINRIEDGGLEEQVARPSAAREKLKVAAKSALDDREHGASIARAETIYRHFKCCLSD